MSFPRRDLGLCLAGGGNRAFWHIGLFGMHRERILPRLAAISACSAGAAAAVMLAADVVEPAREAFARLRRGIVRNFEPRNLVRGDGPLPHEGVYRSTLRAALDDAALARIRESPFPILVLAAEPRPTAPIDETVELGRRDARRHEAALEAFLSA